MATWASRVVVVLVLAMLVMTAVTVLARLAQWQTGPLLFLVSATPYLILVCAVAGILALLARQWVLLGLAVLGVVVVAALWAPAFIGSRDEDRAQALTVMTVNVQFGGADADTVVTAVRESGAQLLSVQELTADELDALERAGLREILPHRYAVPRGRASGSGIWSAYPLSGRRPLADTWLVNLSATA
ncbi:MAG: endonuclease/exonuclease/phosphatase family protein [Candidatus Nanopelagicales bacterium]